MPHKKFSEFAEEEIKLDGEKAKLDDILNKEILITGYKIKGSKYKKDEFDKCSVPPRCLTLQFIINDNKNVIFTGSNVLIEQIEKYKSEIPFYTIIKKIDRYYTFT